MIPTTALAFALDVLVILVFAALRFFDKIDNDVLFLVIGPIVGAMAAKRAPKNGGGPGVNGAVASLVAGLAGVALTNGKRVASMAVVLALCSVGCIPLLPGEAESAVALMRSECKKSPDLCERAIDGVAGQVCPGTDSVRACLRGYVGE